MLKNNDLKIKTIIVAFAFCLVLLTPVFLNSSSPVSGADSPANASAGSADDPLITLSYINKVYTPQISKTIDDKLREIATGSAGVSTVSSNSNASGSYSVLELKNGQRVRAKSESLEIILRQGGTASVISPHKDQGIADLTSGAELLNGTALPVNHSLLIPRADGRGIYVTSSVAYVMVRGDYEIY